MAKSISRTVNEMLNHFVVSPVRCIIQYLYEWLYFWYITAPMAVVRCAWNAHVVVVTRRSNHIRRLTLHSLKICSILLAFIRKIYSTKPTFLFQVAWETVCEIWDLMFAPPNMKRHVYSEAELAELLDYQEIEDMDSQCCHSNNNGVVGKAKQMKHMHYYVPPNPFKATVRVHRRSKPKEPELAASKSGELFYNHACSYPYTFPLPTAGNRPSMISALSSSSQYTEDYANDFVGMDIDEQDYTVHTPYSFPPTPTSRIDFMEQTAEKVDTVMFIARDWLRLQTQSDSVDCHTRSAALRAQSLRYFAVFDSRACDGIALSCGNHSAMKVGSQPCSSVRSVMPITDNTYVYVEFTVSVADGSRPKLSVGLSDSQFNLSDEVGFGNGSIGLNCDCFLSIGSKNISFNGISCGLQECQINDKTTIGILVYRYHRSAPQASDLTNTSSKSNNESHTAVVVNVNGIILPFSTSAQELISTEFANDIVAPLTLDSYSTEPLHDVNSDNVAASSDPWLNMAGSVYPTVSFLSSNTRVYCRFSEPDMMQRTRSTIGAPPGCRVYCLDGTLLLKERML